MAGIGTRISRACYRVIFSIVRLVSPRYALRGTERLYSPYAEASLATDWIPTAPLTLSVGAYDAASKTAWE